MKILRFYTAIVAACLFFSCSGDGYVIKGSVDTEEWEGQKIFLQTQDPALLDSTMIENGSFAFRGRVDGVLQAVVTIGEKGALFVLVNDAIRIDVNSEEPDSSIVRYRKSKAAEHIENHFEENKALFYEPYKALSSLEAEVMGMPEKINAVRLRQDSLVFSYIDFLVGKYEKPESREGLSVIVRDLTRLFGIREQPEKIRELYELVPENEKNSYLGGVIRTFLDQSTHVALGQPVDFDFTDYDGLPGKVSDYKGKLVLIEFWATWCGPCLAQFPLLEQISAHGDKIKVIMVSIDDDLSRWQAKVPEMDASWVNIHYKQEIDLKKHFFVTGIPDNLLLSPEGEILRKKVIPGDIMSLLE